MREGRTAPVDIPVRASEVAELADVIFQTVEGCTIGEDLRSRIAGRIPALGLRSLFPCVGSVTPDPHHSSAWYIAADSLVDDVRLPFLLHMALASAPVNPVYPNATLIGRLRPGGGREIVVHAIPFGLNDVASVRLYVDKIEPGFFPRPGGTQSAVAVAIADPERDLTSGFDAFRRIRRGSGINLASFCHFPGAPVACAWAAIRAGWRFGYSLETPILNLSDDAATWIADGYSTFRVAMNGAAPSAVNGFVSHILRARRGADIEVCWQHPLTAAVLMTELQQLKTAGFSPQLVSVPGAAENAAELAPVARSFGASLSFPAAGLSAESARAAGRAAGRFRCRMESAPASAEEIITLAARLRA